MSMSLACGTGRSDYASLIQGIRHLTEWVKPGNKDEFRSYQQWADARSVRERMALVSKIAEKITTGELVPGSLLVVVAGESHGAIIERAVSQYLSFTPCVINDEFGAVRDIVNLLQAEQVANRGAVVAALVGQGDRRVNGLMRIVRRSLSVDEVRQFSRCVPAIPQANHIEFCLEWLIQAYHERAPRLVVTSLTCALMLVVIKDESGCIQEREPGVGFTVAGDRVALNQQCFVANVIARLQQLKSGQDFDYEIDKVIHLWLNTSQPSDRAA